MRCYTLGSHSHVPLCIHLVAGILLVFSLVVVASCLRDSSGQNEVVETLGSCKSNKKTMASNSKNYIMESYFERYESLLDLNFQEFIAHESLSGLCKLASDDGLRLSVLHRSLDGEGSHRRLSSSFRFNIKPEDLPDFPGQIREVVIIERLPAGVFADPFELQHLVQRGVFTDVEVFGDTNLELPTIVTNRSAVEIHMKVESNIVHRNELEMKIELPLHSRYPPLDDSGYTKVTFGSPDLFVRYTIERGSSSNESCLIFPAKDDARPETGALVWRVPSGRESDTRVVSVVTFISALFSTLVIVWTSISHSDTKTVKLS